MLQNFYKCGFADAAPRGSMVGHPSPPLPTPGGWLRANLAVGMWKPSPCLSANLRHSHFDLGRDVLERGPHCWSRDPIFLRLRNKDWCTGWAPEGGGQERDRMPCTRHCCVTGSGPPTPFLPCRVGGLAFPAWLSLQSQGDEPAQEEETPSREFLFFFSILHVSYLNKGFN